MNLQETYDKKVEQLIKWANAYYVDDNPLASDEEYDKLYHEVLELEKNDIVKNTDSPTNKVGGIKSTFAKVEHPNRMYSQQDIFNMEELDKWLDKINIEKVSTILVDPKFDGMSLKLIYKDGKLFQALTRGDGLVGEDVTNNALRVKNIPKTIKVNSYVEINGEVVISKSNFDIINKEREELELSLFANPRNLASGSMRVLDTNITAERNLEFIPWEVVSKPENDTIGLDKFILEDLGFKVDSLFRYIYNPDGDIVSFIKNIKKHILYINKHRATYDIPLDGSVIKIVDEDIKIDLGYTNKFPKWSVAYKFPAVEKTTKILDIKLQVGRLGTITPVAMLEPVNIDGSTVSNVTLNNFEDIKRKDIRVNDEVTLIKSGDIIPKIVSIFKDRRDVNSVPYTLPITCPTCKTSLIQENSYLKCPNTECEDRVVETLKYFTDRDHMDLPGFGDSVIRHLVKTKCIKNPLDIYKLTLNKIETKTLFGDKTKFNLITSITNSYGKPLWLLLGSLGIPEVGRTISKAIFSEIGINILTASESELLSLKGVGPKIAKNLSDYTKDNYEYLQELIAIAKVNTNKPDEIKRVWRPSIKEVVLSGSSSLGKHVFKDKLESLGISVKSGVSKSTDLLIYGDGSGSKLEKANSLGILTLTYDEVQDELNL